MPRYGSSSRRRSPKPANGWRPFSRRSPTPRARRESIASVAAIFASGAHDEIALLASGPHDEIDLDHRSDRQVGDADRRARRIAARREIAAVHLVHRRIIGREVDEIDPRHYGAIERRSRAAQHRFQVAHYL